MGRTQPSSGAPPASQRKDARAKRAKQTINKDIPALLRAHPKVQAGIDNAELLVNPEKRNTVDGVSTQLGIRVFCGDTLEAAETATQEGGSRGKTKNVAILNMASPLRPGGGFLSGATSQEESLCMRTTLLPSLKDEYYRLPELGGIFTSDVLVFRSYDAESPDLPKTKRFLVDVITSAMHRMPEVEEDESGTKRYVNIRDRHAAEQKIRAVMRMVSLKGSRKIVLGAWGCGTYGNPVTDIIEAFYRVLKPEKSSETGTLDKATQIEDWKGIECIFAISDRRLAQSFADRFKLDVERSSTDECNDIDDPEEQSESANMIVQLEHQIENARSELLKERLRYTLEKLRLMEVH